MINKQCCFESGRELIKVDQMGQCELSREELNRFSNNWQIILSYV